MSMDAAIEAGRAAGTRAAIGRFGRVLVIRLGPGEDVLPALARLLDDADLQSGVILSGLASLHRLAVRNISRFPEAWPILADMRERTCIPGPLEILSMQGNVAPTPDGGVFIHCHLEASIGQPPAVTYGGHLIEGTIVATTAEIVVAEIDQLHLHRSEDPVTRTLELDFEQQSSTRTGAPQTTARNHR